MRVEFRRPDPEDDTVLATATWDGDRVTIETEDEELGRTLTHAFRATPVVTDDASYRRQGTSGAVVVPPGDLEWFRAAAFARARAESGLRPRLIPGIAEGGFDPAANYRPFAEQIERLATMAREAGPGDG
jgi:hypothetical protein